MSKSRSIVILGSLVLVIIVVGSWFLLLSPRMAKTSDLNTQRESVAQANAATETVIAGLRDQKENIGAAATEASALSSRFTATAEESALFALVKEAAAKAGIPETNVSDLTVGVPALGAADGSVTLPVAEPAPAPADGSDPNAAPAPVEGGDPAAAPVDGAAPAPAPAPTAQLGNMTLNMTVAGTKDQIVRFLEALENMKRAYLVESISLGEAEGGGGTATISGTMYLLPELVDPTKEQDPAAEEGQAAVPAPEVSEAPVS